MNKRFWQLTVREMCGILLNGNWLKCGYRNPTGFRRWVKVAKSSGLCYTCVMGTWKSKNRHKYLLQYHIIFVCKYRKKLLASNQVSDDIKLLSFEICGKHHVIIRCMETDKDHIPYMIETEPTMSIRKIVILMKSYTYISYLGKVSKLFAKTLLEGTHFLDRRIFRMQCGECFRRNAA